MIHLSSHEIGQESTREAVNDPRVGDVFTEMYSFGFQVIQVTHSHVTWRSFNSKEIDRGTCTREEWKTKFKYSTIDKYSCLLITRGRKPKVWVRYMEYDELFPGLKMWVTGCESCENGRFQYHHWQAAIGHALDHHRLGCALARKQMIDRGLKYGRRTTDLNEARRMMKERSCGVHQHLGGRL